ncbi:MAG: hypothetical protein KF689_10570 [Gemmatimonadaceae bacterium]|nr:hypothetical protein [Gemmatimonadaceae bacterium]MCW5825958.1 hypothetical protein [Gemmatimonadaceae bacterium]
MRLDIAERLICPEPHARTPLVVVALETRGRDVIRAAVGCMQCRREWTIEQGTLLLDSAVSAPDGATSEPSDALLSRLEALLGVTDPGTPLLLGGRYVQVAPALVARCEAVVAVLPAAGASPEGVGHVQGAPSVVPFADATFAAALLDGTMAPALVEDAGRVVRVGGRIVGDASLPLPPRVRELARDAEHWVGEVQAAPSVVPLRRA